MHKVRISAVRYSNTYPFIYGLIKSDIQLNSIIEIDHPADCARKINDGTADIGLVPVAIIPGKPSLSIISDYCIGSKGPVRTVLLLSNCPVNKVKKIFLDYRSMTSVALTRILAKEYWNCDCEYIETGPDFDFHSIGENEGLVLIGDQCYEMESVYTYKTDLAVEWYRFTGKPFVFACWVSNRKLDKEFLDNFNKAIGYGVNNLDDVVAYYGERGSMPQNILNDYLKDNIDYVLDDEKKVALEIFFKYLDDIK